MTQENAVQIVEPFTSKTPKEYKCYRVDCEECGAEVMVTISYAPAFKDFQPVCPFCLTVAGN